MMEYVQDETRARRRARSEERKAERVHVSVQPRARKPRARQTAPPDPVTGEAGVERDRARGTRARWGGTAMVAPARISLYSPVTHLVLVADAAVVCAVDAERRERDLEVWSSRLLSVRKGGTALMDLRAIRIYAVRAWRRGVVVTSS